jgi:predicted metal-dependent hydrolase
MEPQVLRVGDLDITVKVSDRRRTVQLTVERDATVTALIPPATNGEKLVAVITAKRPWLYARLRERAQTGELRRPREFVSGEDFLYLGRSYRLLLVSEAQHPVRLHHGRLELRRDSVDDAPRHLVGWYRHLGGQWLRKRIEPWAQRMQIEVSALRVMPLGYRWGSCSIDSKLNLHWAAMQLPPVLIDYVLVHELAHIRHANHGAEFWRSVERAMPDCHARRDRLRLIGPELWLPPSGSK